MRGEDELLEAARLGDEDAFAAFYRANVQAITTFFRRRVAEPELAFDLTAETFASAVRGLGGYRRTRGSARGWLFAIAANELAQASRRRRVEDRARRRLGMERLVLDDVDLQRIEELVDDDVLSAALQQLTDHERDAVQRRVVDERTYHDIASELRCSESVVRQRVSRGLRHLRERLEEST